MEATAVYKEAEEKALHSYRVPIELIFLAQNTTCESLWLVAKSGNDWKYFVWKPTFYWASRSFASTIHKVGFAGTFGDLSPVFLIVLFPGAFKSIHELFITGILSLH